ncbi:MAG: twin-arginine translocation signal domain-containing protein [Bryobacterales bacterium]|nr:twin-arginine translocation signal domain-containing protein [Bryobacterales bacterium]
MKKSGKQSINRRGFLKGAAVGAASLVAQVTPANAQLQQNRPNRVRCPTKHKTAGQEEA